MKILLNPIFNDSENFLYEFGVDYVKSTLLDQDDNIIGTDEFDFSLFGEGELENVQSDLPHCPILKAYRKNGILHLELVNFIGVDATQEENFPEWKEV